MSTSCRCPYCQQWFTASLYRPQQVICSQAECQRRRRREYHRQKLASDAEYRQVAQESQKKWREAHPNYLREYRAKHPAAVTRNRQRQQVRDQKPRLAFLEKNNLALDLKRSVAKVWLVGPGVTNLEKNNLASVQLAAKCQCPKCAWKWNGKDVGPVYRGKLFHDFRRTAVRDMLRRGVNPDVIRSITGHETLSMMSRYNITDARDQRAALRIMHAYRQEQDHEQARQLTQEASIRVN